MDPANFLFLELQSYPQVEAIAVEGASVGARARRSGYHVYILGDDQLSENDRTSVLSNYCVDLATTRRHGVAEDECTLDGGVALDIVYGSFDDALRPRSLHEAPWNAFAASRVIYDPQGRLAAATL